MFSKNKKLKSKNIGAGNGSGDDQNTSCLCLQRNDLDQTFFFIINNMMILPILIRLYRKMLPYKYFMRLTYSENNCLLFYFLMEKEKRLSRNLRHYLFFYFIAAIRL